MTTHHGHNSARGQWTALAILLLLLFAIYAITCSELTSIWLYCGTEGLRHLHVSHTRHFLAHCHSLSIALARDFASSFCVLVGGIHLVVGGATSCTMPFWNSLWNTKLYSRGEPPMDWSMLKDVDGLGICVNMACV